MYRRTPKVIAKLEAMRAAKERKRLTGNIPHKGMSEAKSSA